MPTVNQKMELYNHIKYHQPLIDSDHRNSMWYGGDVLSIEYKGHVITLTANGDVEAEYQSGPDGNTRISVKDRSNHGVFYEKMRADIKNDAELFHLSQAGQSTEHAWLEILDNNWWEAFVTKDGLQVTSVVLDSENYDEAMNELLEAIDTLVSG